GSVLCNDTYGVWWFSKLPVCTWMFPSLCCKNSPLQLSSQTDDPAPPTQPKPHPNPNQPVPAVRASNPIVGDSGGGGSHRNEEEQADAPGVIPGIVGAVVVAVAGAISSFIAYQKKKLCFKENAEQGEVDLQNHRNTNAEPAVQHTLLEK
uniref:CD99 molecule (Xg blood group) n=1 Tax=Microcebus murinus TaxID=30608 RepID=A0A8C5Y4M3_MICMU